jgi:hypothetical protein
MRTDPKQEDIIKLVDFMLQSPYNFLHPKKGFKEILV